MKKELIYKNEQKKISFLLATIIFNLLFGLLVLSYFFSKDNNQLFILIFGLIGLVIVNLIYILEYKLPLSKTLKQNKFIKETGTKIPGYIEEFLYNLSYRPKNDSTIIKEEIINLKISYINPVNNKKEILVTPPIAFSPIEDLGSKNCNVYILNDKVLASDFVPKNTTEPSIWSNDDLSVIRMQDEKRKLKKDQKLYLIYGLSLIVILLILSLLIFLTKK